MQKIQTILNLDKNILHLHEACIESSYLFILIIIFNLHILNKIMNIFCCIKN
jgi:hypothetical protein